MDLEHTIVAFSAAVVLGVAPAAALAAGAGGHPTGPPSTVTTGVPSTVTTGPPSGLSTDPSSMTTPTNVGTSHNPASPGSQGTSHQPANPGGQGTSHKPSTPGPGASLPAKAKAYGRYCQDQSKHHIAGQNGTPFSKCVTDMAKAANGQATNPRTACNNEPKRRVSGHRGTPFSLCVSGAAKLLKADRSGTSTTGTGGSGAAS